MTSVNMFLCPFHDLTYVLNLFESHSMELTKWRGKGKEEISETYNKHTLIKSSKFVLISCIFQCNAIILKSTFSIHQKFTMLERAPAHSVSHGFMKLCCNLLWKNEKVACNKNPGLFQYAPNRAISKLEGNVIKIKFKIYTYIFNVLTVSGKNFSSSSAVENCLLPSTYIFFKKEQIIF